MTTQKERLDRVFSRYVRLRDCPGGQGCCISCGAPITPADCDAGHYIPRTHTVTRWNEINVNAQCKRCNQYLVGNIEAYRRGLVTKYGVDVVEALERLYRNVVKLSPRQYELLTEYYNEKIKELLWHVRQNYPSNTSRSM